MSNNYRPCFTDQELITTYLFAIIENKSFYVKDIYSYIKRHWLDWFPDLPSYSKYNHRLNRLYEVFPVLLEDILSQYTLGDVDYFTSLVDSMPIILAGQQRSEKAKVAPQLCDKTYNASKDTWYYGCKVHIIGFRRHATTPLPEYIGITKASEHDLKAIKQVLLLLKDRSIYADKAYFSKILKEQLLDNQDIELMASIKKVKGQENLPFDHQLLNTLISKVRQPIESLFNWIHEKTGIQCARKVRSEKGLLIHVFGKLAAAMIILTKIIF